MSSLSEESDYRQYPEWSWPSPYGPDCLKDDSSRLLSLDYMHTNSRTLSLPPSCTRSFKRIPAKEDLSWPLTACPRPHPHRKNPYTNLPARCGSNLCPFCAHVNATQLGNAVKLSKPSSMLTITNLSEDFQMNRKAIARLTEDLKRVLGVVLSCIWAIEPNRDDQGAHAHLLTQNAFHREKYFYEEYISRLSRKRGFGHVQIEPHRFSHNWYLFKLVMNRPYLHPTEDLARHDLERFHYYNGGSRLCHGTIGKNSLFRDRQGCPTTMKKAVSIATQDYLAFLRAKAAA